MAPLDRLFDDLSRRDRRVRFLSWLAVLLPATSGALLILSLTLHAFGVPFVAGPASGIILATVAVCASTVASAVVALRPVNLATLLYRLDAAVDGEARLSSLHEVRKTGSSRFYEEALTPLVEERSSRYAMILRLTRGARLRVLLGLVLVALVALSPWIGASLRPDRVASGPGSEGFLAAPPEVESEEELDETAEPDASEESAVGDEAVLDDVLESLRTSRTNPDDEVVEELPDAARLEEMQGDGPTTFVGFLFELSERIRNSGAAELSAEERSLISEILAFSPPMLPSRRSTRMPSHPTSQGMRRASVPSTLRIPLEIPPRLTARACHRPMKRAGRAMRRGMPRAESMTRRESTRLRTSMDRKTRFRSSSKPSCRPRSGSPAA